VRSWLEIAKRSAPWRALSWAGAIAILFAIHGAPGARADHLGDQVPGYDISWPQCAGESFPPGPVAFTIVGLNGGRPFTPNPCFIEQYRWAQRFERNPAVYINVDYPKEGRDEPALTGPYGTCPEDKWCRAYNYGYAIGQYALALTSASGITPSMWWLDVETGNFWSDDPTYNAQVIRATIDFFKERNLPLGVYSNSRQWGIIAGPYAPGLPVWSAGAQGINNAAARCHDPSFKFAGGEVHTVQYYDHGFDTNYLCPGGHSIAQYPPADPWGRIGPHSRSIALTGVVLPHWWAIPLLASE
jgi:hypothetical protein